METSGNNMETKHKCPNCKNSYANRSGGLFKHNKKCSAIVKSNEIIEINKLQQELEIKRLEINNQKLKWNYRIIQTSNRKSKSSNRKSK